MQVLESTSCQAEHSHRRETSGSPGSDYEDYCLLGRHAAW